MLIESLGGFTLQNLSSADFTLEGTVRESDDNEYLASNGKKQTSTAISELEIKPSQVGLKFKYHDELKEYYVAIIDPVTSEVIKEIPPKQLLDKYAAMARYMGLIIDRRI